MWKGLDGLWKVSHVEYVLALLQQALRAVVASAFTRLRNCLLSHTELQESSSYIGNNSL